MSFVENMSTLDLEFFSGLGDNLSDRNITSQNQLVQRDAYQHGLQSKITFNHGYKSHLPHMTYINENNFIQNNGVNQYNNFYNSNNHYQLNEANRFSTNNQNVIYNGNNILNNYNVNKSQASQFNANMKSGVVKKQKRIRTAFTTEQILKLEAEYNRTKYLDRNRRVELSNSLGLSERTLKVWFQNRRMKEKKDKAETMDDNEANSTIESVEDKPSFVYEWQGGNYHLETSKYSVEAQMQVPMAPTPIPQGLLPNYLGENKLTKFNTQAWDPVNTDQLNFQLQANGFALNNFNQTLNTKSASYEEDLDISLELLSELSD